MRPEISLINQPSTRPNPPMGSRTSGVREKWIGNSVQREYWCTFHCNSRGLGRGIEALPRNAILPSSCGRYRISSKVSGVEHNAPRCRFYLTQVNHARRVAGECDSECDHSNSSDDEDNNDNILKSRNVRLRMYITHPSDDNLNVIENSTIHLKFLYCPELLVYPLDRIVELRT